MQLDDELAVNWKCLTLFCFCRLEIRLVEQPPAHSLCTPWTPMLPYRRLKVFFWWKKGFSVGSLTSDETTSTSIWWKPYCVPMETAFTSVPWNVTATLVWKIVIWGSELEEFTGIHQLRGLMGTQLPRLSSSWGGCGFIWSGRKNDVHSPSGIV